LNNKDCKIRWLERLESKVLGKEEYSFAIEEEKITEETLFLEVILQKEEKKSLRYFGI
jgi:hypothetical protein